MKPRRQRRGLQERGARRRQVRVLVLLAPAAGSADTALSGAAAQGRENLAQLILQTNSQPVIKNQ